MIRVDIRAGMLVVPEELLQFQLLDGLLQDGASCVRPLLLPDMETTAAMSDIRDRLT